VLEALLLLSAFLLAVALVWVLVWALRDRRPWPRKPHLGHWRKWDDDEDGDD
jgi:hypothetical protein